jgi:hypothetical protein
MKFRPENAEFESVLRKLLETGFFLSLTEECPSGSWVCDELKKFADEQGATAMTLASAEPFTLPQSYHFRVSIKCSLVFRSNRLARERSEKSGLSGSRFEREV